MSQSCKLTGRPQPSTSSCGQKSSPFACLACQRAANIQDMIRGHRRAPDTTNSRADLDLLGEVIRAWSGLRPRCDPFRKRQRCVVLMEGISGERHLHANVARVRTAVRAQEAGCEPAGPVSTVGTYSSSWSLLSNVRLATISRVTSGYPS